MTRNNPSSISRRTFVRQSGLAAAGSALLGAQALRAADTTAELPRRTLGRTGVDVSALSIGTAAMGYSKHVSVEQAGRIISTALDEGVNIIDTARHYARAEQGVALGLGSRRKETFLATKVWADSIDTAERSLATSFETLKTDYIDLLYYHSVGQRQVEGAIDPGGVFDWLVKQKKAGRCRFIGLSGHNLPERFIPFLETGEVDVVMMLMNFVDRYTYNFEGRVLPLAREKNVGVVAMKVFGGPLGGFRGYGGPKAPPLVGQDYVESAIRYALDLEGVATVNLGVHDPEQVRENVRIVKNYRPLSDAEQVELAAQGKKMAADWGPHFGDVTEEA